MIEDGIFWGIGVKPQKKKQVQVNKLMTLFLPALPP